MAETAHKTNKIIANSANIVRVPTMISCNCTVGLFPPPPTIKKKQYRQYLINFHIVFLQITSSFTIIAPTNKSINKHLLVYL